jgi:di/tricarboxylate transporter
LPPAIAILLAAVFMVLAGSIDMAGAYDEINWQSVILIAAVLPLATALQKTGGMDLIVSQLRPFSEAGPLAMMAAIFVLTGLTGLFISNTATAALIAPIALGAAQQLDIAPHPLLMTVAIASTTAFATPVATPANMLILGPGDYRFMDYVRVGLPLQAIFLVLTLVIVPLLFPF